VFRELISMPVGITHNEVTVLPNFLLRQRNYRREADTILFYLIFPQGTARMEDKT
jgi:hypothetical protein